MSKVGTARSVSPLSGTKGDTTKNYVSCRNQREPGRKARAGSTAAGGPESLSLVDAGDLNVSSHRLKCWFGYARPPSPFMLFTE